MASSKVSKVTEGVLSRVTDFTLYLVAYHFELIGKRPTMAGTDRAAEEAGEFLSEVNYQSIKRALSELKRMGLVRTAKRNLMEAEITAAGKRRINSLIPQYQKRRPWDKNIYLVTYDIPVGNNNDRNVLREFLRKIGCGLLQESIWVAPYNPTRIVREFVEERDLEGMVLVSVLGKEGSIGGMSLEELIEHVYSLSELNGQYEGFLYQCSSGGVSKAELAFQYLAILGKDPQIPFELLPDWWVGDEAYKEFTKLLTIGKKAKRS